MIVKYKGDCKHQNTVIDDEQCEICGDNDLVCLDCGAWENHYGYWRINE